MLSINASLFFTMINLVILVLLLRKFLIRPIMNIMEKRETMIAEGLKNAKDEQEKASALRTQYEDALNGANEESQKMIVQAKTDARQEYERIMKDADSEASKLMQSAKETIDVERKQALRDMKTEVAGLAMQAARKIVTEQCGMGENQMAYDRFLKDAGDYNETR